MSISELIEEMNQYYMDRIPYHDHYMGYTSNPEMEKLLTPIIERIEGDIVQKDILEVGCGTGNWTQVLSKRANSVMATDAFQGYLAKAKEKDYPKNNVEFRVADVYSLEGIECKYNLAFASDLWSHIPKSKISRFIESLHSKLLPRSKVIMMDMTRTMDFFQMFSHFDEEKNEVQKRRLPNGKEYRVIKNFPTEEELKDCVKPYAADMDYHEDKELKRWILSYCPK